MLAQYIYILDSLYNTWLTPTGPPSLWFKRQPNKQLVGGSIPGFSKPGLRADDGLSRYRWCPVVGSAWELIALAQGSLSYLNLFYIERLTASKFFNTWLLIESTPKGVVFSFLLFHAPSKHSQ